jgi:hypothetical protein
MPLCSASSYWPSHLSCIQTKSYQREDPCPFVLGLGLDLGLGLGLGLGHGHSGSTTLRGTAGFAQRQTGTPRQARPSEAILPGREAPNSPRLALASGYCLSDRTLLLPVQIQTTIG